MTLPIRTFVVLLAAMALAAFGVGCEEQGTQDEVQPGQEDHVGQATQQGQADQDTGLEQESPQADADQPDAQPPSGDTATGGGPTPANSDDPQKARGEDAARQGTDRSGDRGLQEEGAPDQPGGDPRSDDSAAGQQ